MESNNLYRNFCRCCDSLVQKCSSSAEVYAYGYNASVAGVIAYYYNTSYSELSATGDIGIISASRSYLSIAGDRRKGKEVCRNYNIF